MSNKVPPPLWMILTGALMWLLAHGTPEYQYDLPYNTEIGFVVFSIGVYVIVRGILHFARIKTTVNPLDLTASTQLATGGIFRFSRNPMYLGMVLILVAWGIRLGAPVNILCIFGFMLLITEWQIKPEEAALREIFGEEYEAYCRRVRRWI